MTIPLCQQCGKKLYMNYGKRGILARGDTRFNYHDFKTQEERDAHEIPSNATDIYRRNNLHLSYETPQQSRHGLFHSQTCFYEWHHDHREDIERVIRTRGEWKS